jgi:pimeloyl-[acyl-carrier protein] methyl ester esterase
MTYCETCAPQFTFKGFLSRDLFVHPQCHKAQESVCWKASENANSPFTAKRLGKNRHFKSLVFVMKFDPMNWVFLRGLGREQRHWFDFPTHLKTQLASHAPGEILTLDLPGVGTEKAAKAPLTIRENTDYLREQFLKRRSKDGPWGLIGISLGGMIAMDWAHRHPGDWKALVLINSSASDLSALTHRLSLYGIYRLLRTIASKDPATRERQVLKMISNLKVRDSETLQSMVDLAIEAPIAGPTLMRQLAAATRFRVPSEITVPTLILASLKDAMVDVRCSKVLADRLQCPIKFHPTAGHELTLDDPAWVAERISEFLSTKN